MRNGENGLFKSRPLYITTSLVLLVVLIFSLMLAVTFGSVRIPLRDVYGVILYNLAGIGDASVYGSGKIRDVVWIIRLPRLLLSMSVGIGLAICGVIMQAVVKNPLAEPYTLGISSGASLGATVAILMGIGTMFGSNYVGVMAFLGAFCISLAVVGIANLGGRATSVKLLLAGMALSSICSAFSSFIVYFAHDRDGIKDVSYWLMGSFAGASWENLRVLFPIVILAFLFFWSQYRNLNLMLLGDEVSITLGTDLHRLRQLYLLVSAAVVGLIIPHLVRMLFGTDHKKLLPICALVGGIFLIWADVLCRVIIPGMELPVGILTSMIGAPCFIYLMVRRRYGFGGAKE